MKDGKASKCHFKVQFTGEDNGRRLVHDHLIYIEHRQASGNTSRYQVNNRDKNYDYSTLQASNGGPTNSPYNQRVRREQGEAKSA